MPKPWEKYKKQSGPWEKYSPGGAGPMGFVNKGIASGLGAPVDVITSAVNLIPGVDIKNPPGGSQSIENLMGSAGIGLPQGEPQTVAEHAGDVVGQTSVAMLGIAGMVNRVAKTAGLAGEISKNIVRSAARHPYMTMLSEFTGSVGAGTGRGAAKMQGAEDPTANLAEIGGGVVGSMAPTAMLHAPTMMAVKTGKNLFYKLSSPFSKSGSKYRAQKYIHDLVPDPEKTATALGQKNIGDLPPAVRAGEKRLSALYKSLTTLDPVEEGSAIEKISRSIMKLERSMRDIGYGSPEVLEELTRKRVASIELGMDNRVSAALETAQKKLNAIPAAKRQGAEAAIVNSELRRMLGVERATERTLWSNVPKQHRVDFDETRAVYRQLVDDTPQAQMEDIPPSLKKSFITNPRGKKAKKTTWTTVHELSGLRSKLLEVSKRARKEKKWNRARIANEVADAILEDLGVSAGVSDGPASAALKAALAQSRKIHERFNSGTVGKILGYGRDGAPAIDPTLTLDVSIGRGGVRGAVDIQKVAPTQAAMEATEKYLARSFTDHSVGADGVLNTVKSKRWISNNEDILDQFPLLRKQLSDASEAQKVASATTERMAARKAMLRDPKVSTSAQFLNRADLGREISHIFKERNPASTLRELSRQALKDPSGDAIGGLRAGVVEHILDHSTVGPYNELGQKTLSGRSIIGFVRENRPALLEVFSKKQVARLYRVGDELAKVEKYSGARPSGEIELKDPASTALRIFARITGARIGGIMGRESAGGSLQMAQITSGRFSQFMKYVTKNRAEALIQDAVLSDDPSLLRSLLAPIGGNSRQSAENAKILNAKMNAWLADAGGRVFEDIQKEISGQQ